MPQNHQAILSTRRIAKNTILLYLRMVVTMLVSLFTSRVILQTLGISDYGIYNVVGGFVSMIAYMNSVFVDADQRFITFYLGQGNLEKLKRIFSTAVTVQIVFSIVILCIAETFGIWFINNKLFIDPDRLVAANWVYQCSIGSLILTLLNVPYVSCVVAHEKMGIYAYTGVVEVILRLVIVYLLVVISADKLIVYAILGFIISFLVPIWYRIYCWKQFEECRFSLNFDKTIFKEMFSFSGWVLVGNLGFSFKDQFSSMIMNIFLGTTINAARGITTQVSGAVVSFVNSFLIAMAPQITKLYAAEEFEKSKTLVYAGSKYAFFLMMIMCIPLMVNIDHILSLWLGTAPEYTGVFIIITLIATMYYAMSKPLTTALQATGDIKWFQIGIAIIMLTELPIAYIILKHELSPVWAIVPSIFTNIIGIIYRVLLLCNDNKHYNFGDYCLHVVLKCTIIFIIGFSGSLYIKYLLTDNPWGFILSLLLSFTISALLVVMIGINSNERLSLIRYIVKNFRH